MAQPQRHALALFALAAVMLACSHPGTIASPVGQTRSGEAGGEKKITVVVAGDPYTLYQKFNLSSTVRGVEELELILNAGFSVRDDHGDYRPQLAEQVPSLENGLWRLLPDGRMETTWRIRDGAQWHDGTPVTAADAIFAAQVGSDRDLPISRHNGLNFVEGIDAPDSSTVTVRWKQPYIEADRMFSAQFALPLPSHLLETAYATDKASFPNIPFWTEDFVGTGPFKLREFARASHMTLAANDSYILGPPKLRAMEVRFIPDPTTLLANVLAGSAELALGRGISLEQGLQARSQWRDGKAEMALASFLQIFPQLLNPSPAVISNPDFRRALLEGIDRQEMIESIQSGVVPIAHVFVAPDQPEYADIEPSVVKYAFDPRRAGQIVQQLGYTKGTDGVYRDGAGQRLTVEIRATAGDLNQKTMFSVADYWQRLGLDPESVSVPPQRAPDLEYRATFPGFAVQRQGGEIDFLQNFHSRQARIPENRYAGNNNTRYMNPELDALIDRYASTIPLPERMAIASQAVRHITDFVVELPLYYDVQPALIANRLVNVYPAGGTSQTAWNAHEWDVR